MMFDCVCSPATAVPDVDVISDLESMSRILRNAAQYSAQL